MNNICLKIAVAMIANIGLFASSANASITTYGCADADTCTLQELFDGGYFDIDDLRFSNWSFVSSSYTTPEAPDPSLIDVEIYDDAASLDFIWGLPGEGPGFRTIDETSIYGAEHRSLKYAFQVSTLGSHLVINSNALILDAHEHTSGAVGLLEVNERVADNQSLELATKQVSVEFDGDENTRDFAEFADQSTILVETDFLEEGSLLNDESIKVNLTEYWQRFGYATVFSPIPIDIMPSKKTENVINLNKKNLKVAILGSLEFDALQVDPATVKFGTFDPDAASPTHFKGKDYNRDGYSDLILTFNRSETGIVCGVTEATLTGETSTDPVVYIQGTDSFTIEGCP